MNFAHPQLLWLLLVLPPVLALFFWWGNRLRQKLLVQFVEARLLSSLTVGLSPMRRKIRFALVIVAVALLLIAIARPQYGYDKEEVQQKGLDIVVAVDTSKSMLATDIAPNRLTRAKLAALELMQRAARDRLGLVAFAGNAFLECPLTVDDTAFQQSVQALDVNSIPEGGTSLAQAINTALTAFKEKNSYKALVLLTDGEDNDEGALEAAQNAAKAGLKIFTVGIGTTAGALLDPNLVRDPDGNAVKSHLNETLLKQIAAATGGFYLPLRGADTMELLYDKGLAPLPKSEGVSRVVRRYHEQYQWPLAAAILLLLVEAFLPERRTAAREAVGKTTAATASSSSAQTAATTMLLGLLLLPAAVKASPVTAFADYQSGKFTNALTEFTRLAAVQTNDLRLVFNAGDAAYRATNFDLAESLFAQATLSQDLKLQEQAYYNLGNAQFQMAKQAKDLDGLEEGFDGAAKTYARAVTLNTNDLDAAYNLQFAKAAAEQVRQLKAALLRGKNSADDAVRRAEFHTAFEIMADLTQKYKIAAKQFEEFTKKLKQIDDIATPHQP
ncbi:MAG TPA: VWA domain-containing protein [Candidatus Acidoferrales bacterium]|nr:VWA domain-containing protein [Candidatus Acidoferrales bacterium]